MGSSVIDTKVSIFSGALGIKPVGQPTLREILDDIKSEKYKLLIGKLRELNGSGDKVGYEDGKKKLPGFTLSALLKTRDKDIPLPEKLIAHTNLLQIDIDEVPGQIEFFEARLRNDPVILFFFRSPSGGALKVGIRIDGTRHHESYLSAERYFLEKYQVKIDPKVKEVPRLCFVSYDPNLFINENAVILPLVAQAHTAERNIKSVPASRKPGHGARAMATAEKMIARSTEGEKLNELLKAAKLLGGYVSGHMLSRGEAESCLRAAIEQKPGVNSLKTAYKAIESGLSYGEKEPFDFEDLEHERLRYNRQYLLQPDKPDKPDKSDVTGQHRTATGQKPDKSDNSPDNTGQVQEVNLYGLIRQWVNESPGKFNTSDIDRDLGITLRQAKKNRSDCLSEMVCEGIIERDLNRRGHFRKKNTDLTEMDILGAKSDELPIELPFSLSKYIEINNKEIILFMGESNSGKTTVIFNMIWSNLRTLKAEGILQPKGEPVQNGNFGIRYFSSEMGPTGVRKKLICFGEQYPISEWVKYVSSVERNQDFQDVVDPYGLNFIDYLEVFDGEYFKLSSHITAIHTALKTGIAVIALQKKTGTDIGRGGEATLEKPRLALALSENKERGYSTVKIVKAKHYRDRNPAGLEKDFIIRRRGTKIIDVSDWGYARDHQIRRNSMNYHEFDKGE